MKNVKFGLGAAAAAIAVVTMVGSTVSASAQGGPDTTGAAPMERHGYAARTSARRYRPLTVAKTMPRRPASPLNAVTAPIGIAGQIVTAPLSGLSQAFGYGPIGAPARPLPIVARYAGAGPVTDSVNQGWAQPVPLSANGPVYKLEPVSNNGGVSPFTLIAAPITAATTLAAAPVNAVGALVGAPPAPPPVF